MNWSRLLPSAPAGYHGSRVAFWYLVLVAIVSTVRSLIHMFAPDGGANSIAGLAVDIAGGANVIAIFAQWGASQLILAVFYWLAILRYRFLVPLMLAVVCLEQILRLAAGLLKPMEVTLSPPGEIGTLIALPLSLVALLLSLLLTSTDT
jgi:hypothetical protein